MTEFETGDQVVVTDYEFADWRDRYVGKTGTIQGHVHNMWFVDLDTADKENHGFKTEELELIQDPRDAALDAISTLTEAWETNGEVPTYLLRMILSTVNR